MEFLKRRWKESVVGILLVANLFIWIAVWQRNDSDVLRVYFFDAGQGDAIFIDSPSHGRVLIDGGPDRKVLSELGRVLPFGDKRIDVMIESHPDKDHIAGLPEVVSRYKVGMFLEPGVESPNTIDDELHARVVEKQVPDILARRNMVIDFGDGAKLVILYPDRDVRTWETNDASIVAKLVYGDTSFLLTGDSPKKAEYLLLGMNIHVLDSDVLKAGHHGSRTSSSLPYVEAVSPKYAVISAGKNNDYGHPHKETIDTLTAAGAIIVSTSDRGTILFESDGKKISLK